jgi:calmodulin
MSKVRAAFDEHDADGNGKIDLTEFRALTTKLGLELARAEAEALFDAVDEDETGLIEFEEFEAWYEDHVGKA